jgi:multisubunit Na+/H+ antiporter MnhB subunit
VTGADGARVGAVLGGAAVYLLALLANWRWAPRRSGEWARSGFILLLFVGILALLNKPRATIAAASLLTIVAIAWPWLAPSRAGVARKARGRGSEGGPGPGSE